MVKKKKQLKRRRRARERWVGLRNMSITPSLQRIPNVLGIFILGSNHPTKLVMPPLNKVMECDMLSLNIS